jgi:hypothetical protein
LSLDGIRNVKFKDLSEFFKLNKNFNDSSKEGKLIRRLINEADKIFIEKNKVFRNRALIVSFFVLLKSLIDKGFKLTENSRILLKNFYDHFYARLQTEIDKGASATDAELIIFQSKVNQDADSRESIQIRNNILSRNLILYDEIFRKYLDTSEIDNEYNQLKIARDTKILADTCLEHLASLNKAYSTNKGEDLFKLTNELFVSLPKIGNTINSKEDYKNFIDALYKIFYEGSGSLKRIPDSFKTDNSIFFDIKHLRTDLYHDVEHGKTSDVRKKKQIISNIYYKYTSKKTLNSLKVTEHRMIQAKMLIKINSELVSILESL